jgi:hypothetical protein
MGAKIVLSGQAIEIEKTGETVSFTIHTGPATRRPPRGLDLYDRTRYRVTCTTQLWESAHKVPDDPSDLLVEGYIEPRRDPESDELYIAVVATAMQSTRPHNERRLAQLQEALDAAREAFRLASERGVSKNQAQAKAAAFVKANDRLKRFLERHPELKEPEPEPEPESEAESEADPEDAD